MRPDPGASPGPPTPTLSEPDPAGLVPSTPASWRRGWTRTPPLFLAKNL